MKPPHQPGRRRPKCRKLPRNHCSPTHHLPCSRNRTGSMGQNSSCPLRPKPRLRSRKSTHLRPRRPRSYRTGENSSLWRIALPAVRPGGNATPVPRPRPLTDPLNVFECERRELNPHALRHWILSPARLPIPPLSREPESKQIRLSAERCFKNGTSIIRGRV